ncbi:DUF2531 family protein, partial [Myxococcus sp. AM001]|nr:DUF2531 family protein [Myxococcus sp. AM001]
VRMDEQLPTGWRVSRLTAGELDIVTSSGCEPPAWRWQREGKQHDAMDKPAASAAAAGGDRAAGAPWSERAGAGVDREDP